MNTTLNYDDVPEHIRLDVERFERVDQLVENARITMDIYGSVAVDIEDVRRKWGQDGADYYLLKVCGRPT